VSLTQGLYSYEIVILVLGAAFFLILLGGFVTSLVKGKPYIGLLPFFVLTIGMMGFPSVKSFQYKDGMLTIEKTTDQLQRDPTNTALRTSLQTQLSQLEARPAATPEALVSIAAAQFALGQHAAAKDNLAKVPPSVAESPQAVKLKTLISLDERLSALTLEVQKNPANRAAGAELAHAAEQVAQLPVASPLLLNRAARAQAVIGNVEAAHTLEKKVMKIDPKLLNTH